MIDRPQRAPWQGFRIGAKLGLERPNQLGGNMYLGWATVLLGTEGAYGHSSDPVGEVIANYRRLEAERGPGDGVNLYKYRDDMDFRNSLADKTGLTRAQHNNMIDAAARRIRAAGIKVTIMQARPASL